WGKTVDNVRELSVITYGGTQLVAGSHTPEELLLGRRQAGRIGELYRGLGDLAQQHENAIRTQFPQLTRRVSGYNLDQLLPENGFNLARALVGTEGTCVTLLEATVELVPSPAVRVLTVVGYPGAFGAADAARGCLDLKPLTVEGMDEALIAALRAARPADQRHKLLPAGEGWLFIETGGAHPAAGPAHAPAHPRPGPGPDAVGDPRGRGGHPHPRGRRPGGLARLGGHRGPARAARRVPAGVPQADGRPRAPRHLLRALRRRVRAHPDRLRPDHRARHRRLPPVHRGGGRPGHRPRRLAVRRARRRAGPRGTAAADVPAGADRRVRPVQGGLGPAGPDEPRHHRPAPQARRRPACVRGRAPARWPAPAGPAPRPRQPGGGHPALRGRRRLPVRGGQRDVP